VNIFEPSMYTSHAALTKHRASACRCTYGACGCFPDPVEAWYRSSCFIVFRKFTSFVLHAGSIRSVSAHATTQSKHRLHAIYVLARAWGLQDGSGCGVQALLHASFLNVLIQISFPEATEAVLNLRVQVGLQLRKSSLVH
jgi:hypothetical protein